VKRRLDAVIRGLEIDPRSDKPLRGELSGKWSTRIGDYRVIYIINDQEKIVTLLSVKHRKAAYR
jgi:mRNA interferase RelE/StbE